jgi:hypothetical protein
VFTARNRQNAFAKRRREAREAQQAETPPAEPTAVPYDTRNDASDDITDAPDVSTYATGGVVEQPKPTLVEPSEDEEHETAVIVDLPTISAETRAKVDAVLNHAITPVDDAAPVESEPEPAAAPAENEPKRGRGRPRPQETIDRDNAVHALLTAADPDEGVSKEALALSLDEKEQQVYSSLRQLSKEGRAETRYVKPHGYRWFAL